MGIADAQPPESPDYQPVFENRVRLAETDQQGTVFYGEYVTFQDEAVSEFLRRIGYGDEERAASDWQLEVIGTALNYRDDAERGDLLVNELRVAEMEIASLTFDYRARRAADDAVVADGSVSHVAVDEETEEPTAVPAAFREAVAEFQGELPTGD